MFHCMLHGMLEYVTMEGQIGEPRGYWLVLVPLPKFAAKAAASNTNDVAAVAFGPLPYLYHTARAPRGRARCRERAIAM